MKIQKFNTEEEWLDERKGKVGGTRAKDLVVNRGTKPKKGFYEIIAERIAIPASEENVMDRGHRLEVEAVERLEKVLKKKFDKSLVIISRDDNSDIYYSPDAFLGKTIDCEVKCLNSASHIQAYLTKEIPNEYWEQVLQGFVVNDQLKKRYVVFYDPRMPVDFFFILVERKDVQGEVEKMLKLEVEALELIAKYEKDLTF